MKNTFLLILFSFCFFNICRSQLQLSPSEFIVNSTIKIESVERKMQSGVAKYFRSSGTGFFFNLQTSKGSVPVIITNKHVIKDAINGSLHFKLADTSGNFSYKIIEKVDFKNFNANWIMHPDTSVDLAIMPIAPILNSFKKQGKTILYAPYTEDLIPNDSIRNTLTAIEDVIMVGYPFGLRDAANDLPVVRKGLTATPPYLDYNSLKEFLCDLPVYPGSSGSPIVIYNPTTFTTRDGNTYLRPRIILLGINYATYTRDFQGKVVPKASYNIEDSLITTTPIPYNIGIIVKSERIFDFKPILEKMW